MHVMFSLGVLQNLRFIGYEHVCLFIVVLLFAIIVRLNGEQTFVVEKSCEQRQHSKASGTPHKLPIFMHYLVYFYMHV